MNQIVSTYILKKLRHTLFLVVLFCALIISCSKKSPKGYKVFELGAHEWESKSIHKFAGEVNYTATEVPIQYYILKNTPQLNPESKEEIYTTVKTERIIEMDFKHVASKDLLQSEFSNRSYKDAVKYLSFSISDDFKIVTTSNDTISCSGINFERTFNVAPYKRVLLYFNGVAMNENITLLYKDKLFGNGFFKFNFKETPIKL